MADQVVTDASLKWHEFDNSNHDCMCCVICFWREGCVCVLDKEDDGEFIIDDEDQQYCNEFEFEKS